MSEHRHRTLPEHVKAGIDRPPDVVRVREVIEVEFRRGEGCCDADPVRACWAYYSTDGEFLAERDLFVGADPEFARLLAEEAEIEAATRSAHRSTGSIQKMQDPYRRVPVGDEQGRAQP